MSFCCAATGCSGRVAGASEGSCAKAGIAVADANSIESNKCFILLIVCFCLQNNKNFSKYTNNIVQKEENIVQKHRPKALFRAIGRIFLSFLLKTRFYSATLFQGNCPMKECPLEFFGLVDISQSCSYAFCKDIQNEAGINNADSNFDAIC